MKFTDNLDITKLLVLNPSQSHSRGQAEFFVDTSSPTSLIAPSIALNLDLPLNSFNFKGKAYIGGSKIRTAKTGNVEVAMQGENNEVFKENFSFSVTEYEGKQAASLDNILGMDFIKKFAMNLIVKTNEEDRAFLEY